MSSTCTLLIWLQIAHKRLAQQHARRCKHAWHLPCLAPVSHHCHKTKHICINTITRTCAQVRGGRGAGEEARRQRVSAEHRVAPHRSAAWCLRHRCRAPVRWPCNLVLLTLHRAHRPDLMTITRMARRRCALCVRSGCKLQDVLDAHRAFARARARARRTCADACTAQLCLPLAMPAVRQRHHRLQRSSVHLGCVCPWAAAPACFDADADRASKLWSHALDL